MGEIVGATAVVVSLVYLASQLRQSNALDKENAYRELHRDTANVMMALINDAELHKLWREGFYENKPLDDAERERLGLLLSQVFMALNVAHHSSRLDSDLRDFVQARLNVHLGNTAVRDWWRRQRKQLPDPFRSEVDAIVSRIDKEQDTQDEKST